MTGAIPQREEQGQRSELWMKGKIEGQEIGETGHFLVDPKLGS